MKRLTTEQFIQKAKQVHGNKYDYSLVKYINAYTKVCIICSEHGKFWQRPTHHYNENCPKCETYNRHNKNIFIQKAKQVHGNKYDYRLVKYINAYTKVKIICKKCKNIFKQRPHNHLIGNNCPICQNKTKLNNLNRQKRFNNFLNKAKQVHGNKYNYDHLLTNDYIGFNSKIKILCLEHGYFLQTPNKHLSGRGCPKCSNKNKTTMEFIKQANLIHNNLYDYSLVKYQKCNIPIKIICKKHGVFKQKPSSHLCGCGCIFCNSSKGELIIEQYLKEHNIKFKREYKFNDCKGKRNLLPFDFYLPTYNICIEYDGIQHFKPVNFGGISLKNANENFKKLIINDNIKNKYCKDNNIKLIRLSYLKLKYIVEILKIIFPQ